MTSLPGMFPLLRSLHRQPSWVNRAGNVDRSACFEVRASEVWPQISRDDWDRARTSAGRQAAAVLIVTARILRDLHDSRPPQQLVGDWRTHKSNVMKGSQSTHARECMGIRERVGFAGDLNLNFAFNPNKGATRTKKLGLWGAGQLGFPDHDWEQTVRIERWERRLRRTRSEGMRRDRSDTTHGVIADASHPFTPSPAHPVNLSPPPSHQHFLICPSCRKKMLKLMMVLATEQEIDDAEFAEGWVDMLDARQMASRIPLTPELIAQRSQLISRYGLLFRGRQLVCRNCLGVRYGEVKPKRRRRSQIVIVKNPKKAGARAKRASSLTREERAALRQLKGVMTSIRSSNETPSRFSQSPWAT